MALTPAGTTTSDQLEGGTSLTVSHTAGATADIIVIGSGASTGGVPAISSVTYDGNTCAEVDTHVQATSLRLGMHYLLDSDTTIPDGAVNAVVTWASYVDECCVGIVSYAGSHQTTPFGTPVHADGTTGPAAVDNLSSASGEICLAVGYCLRIGMTAAAGGTQLWEEPSIAGSSSGAMSSEAGAADVDMELTLDASGFSDQWVMIGAPLVPEPTGGEALVEVYAEAVQAVDGSVFARALARSRGETIQVAGGAFIAKGLLRIYDDAISIIHGLVSRLGLGQVLDEAVAISGTIATPLGLIRVLDNAVSLIEGLAKTLGLARVLDETVEVDGGTSTLKVAAKILGEATQIIETIVKAIGLVKVHDETETVVDDAVRATTANKIYDETVSVIETVAKVLPGLIAKVYSDTMNLVASITSHRDLARTHDDGTVQASETFGRPLGLSRVLSESVSVAEAITSHLGQLIKLLTEEVRLQEATVLSRSMVRVFSEAVSVASSIVKKLPFFVVVDSHKWTAPHRRKSVWKIK